MDGEAPSIEVRAVTIDDAAAIHALDYSFETDRIFTLCVQEPLEKQSASGKLSLKPGLAFELHETVVDPPLYKNYREFENTLDDVETRLHDVEGGFVAIADGQVAGVVLLNVDEWRLVARIEDIIVGRQFRRYGIGSLLLNCAADWARHHGCWAILLETQNVNYPAIHFYLNNGLEVWGISRYFYPPGPVEHEVAIFMGKRMN
jgi:GNAT superfamily N-acetyltransferase